MKLTRPKLSSKFPKQQLRHSISRCVSTYQTDKVGSFINDVTFFFGGGECIEYYVVSGFGTRVGQGEVGENKFVTLGYPGIYLKTK